MVDSDEDGGDYAELMAASPLDIKEYAHSYAFVIDMPGMDPSDVRVQVKADNVILISSERRRAEEEGAKYITMERRMGKFMRKFALPDNANASKITTVSRNGELTVTVEKLPPPQPKEIEVKREPLGRCKVGIGASSDRISLLPDELLVCILSLLSFKEATASSILSRRWRSLHTYTSKINFDCTRVLWKAGKRGFEGFDEIKRKYLGCIDSYVRLNQSSVLEKFRVFFYLTGSEAHHIDEWIRFALSKKVESLELLSIYDICAKNIKRYTLDFHKFNHDGLKLMKKLSTHMVNVSGEAVEMLSRNCPLLEQVSIAESAQLLSLKIIKPFPSLRSLEILHCHNLSLVVVDDSNIVSFKYYGDRVNKVVLVNVPLLTEIWIYGMCTDRAEDALEMFSSVLPQLHTFKIGVRSFSREQLREFCSEFCSRVKMSNLKQLVVDTLQVLGDRDPLPLIDLIKASPRLQRFVIEVPYDKDRADNDFVEAEPIEIRAAASADRMLLRDYPHLKEVEFVGYRGVTKHFELLKYLVENAIALETIVVDPWGIKEPFHISFDRIPRRKYNHKVFAGAYAFKHCVPFGINVKIL